LALHKDVLGYTSIGGVELITVAASNHPLATQRSLQATSARDYTQLVLTDRSKLTEGQDFQVTSDRTWRVADLSTKHALLLAGLGWGNMPAPMVARDLEEGRLVRLIIPQMGGIYGFRVAHRLDTPPGPAASWLVKYLENDKHSTELPDHSI
jgi:DNA-binding transcriptional LysR family regulator